MVTISLTVTRREELENALKHLRLAELALVRAGAVEGDVENLRVFRALIQAQAEAGYFDEKGKN